MTTFLVTIAAAVACILFAEGCQDWNDKCPKFKDRCKNKKIQEICCRTCFGDKAPAKVACVDINKTACPTYKKHCKHANVKAFCCKTCSVFPIPSKPKAKALMNMSPDVEKKPKKVTTDINLSLESKEKVTYVDHGHTHRRKYTKKSSGKPKGVKNSPMKVTTKQNQAVGTQERICLNDANKYREWHPGTPLLVYDTSLAKKAQEFAEKLLASVVKDMNEGRAPHLFHDTKRNLDENMGENVFMGANSETGKLGVYCQRANKGWYKEIDYYDYSTQTKKSKFRSNPNLSIGHFTQMLWKTTSKVGYGYATIKDPRPQYKKYNLILGVAVAKYSTPGNFMGQFSTNVLPQTSGCAGSKGCAKVTKEDRNTGLV